MIVLNVKNRYEKFYDGLKKLNDHVLDRLISTYSVKKFVDKSKLIPLEELYHDSCPVSLGGLVPENEEIIQFQSKVEFDLFIGFLKGGLQFIREEIESIKEKIIDLQEMIVEDEFNKGGTQTVLLDRANKELEKLKGLENDIHDILVFCNHSHYYTVNRIQEK
jgi:hypothetical protein